MNTVTLVFFLFKPSLIFTGVTSFKYDLTTGKIFITHDKGSYEDCPDDLDAININ